MCFLTLFCWQSLRLLSLIKTSVELVGVALLNESSLGGIFYSLRFFCAIFDSVQVAFVFLSSQISMIF